VGIVLYSVAIALGFMGALTVIKYGRFFGLVDIPNNRSSHSRPTPKGGGLGILAAFIVVALWTGLSIWFWGAVTMVAFISLMGDRIHLSPGFRLVIQFGAAIVVVWAGIGGAITNPSYHFDMPLGLAAVAFLLVFIVGTANIYNFMDGINGIAAITGIIGFSLVAFYAFSIEDGSSEGIVCISLAFACLGFLPFNMPKARVFMGDVGSILLGFVFAVLVSELSRTWLEFICLCACLFPFYADELSTMAVRINDGERLSKPHRRHLYQIFVNEMEISHWKVSMGYGLAQLVVGLSMLWLIHYGSIVVVSVILVYFCLFIAFSYIVRMRLVEN